ncbi:hypothetical protein GIB67_014343 [Kingdonia uniflora]|uniref:Uncharacterized protein n=1 Tax=Kingdonia uniflora TaxID=39325 RepID=A0A7J7NTJ9_9MAGN|nr:hypothetical protein GIB67_014343 [Kingdonia uniflora]
MNASNFVEDVDTGAMYINWNIQNIPNLGSVTHYKWPPPPEEHYMLSTTKKAQGEIVCSPSSIPLGLRALVEDDAKGRNYARMSDPDLQSFDASLQDRANHVINALAFGGEVQSFSFDSLKEVTGCLLEMDQQVVKVILDCKQDIWKNQELLDLVEEYFENSLQTLDFCTALEKCLKRARDSQLIINVALQQFEEEEQDEGVNQKKYLRTLEELKNFKVAGDPFTEEFCQMFKSVTRSQVLMIEKLQAQRSKLDKKLKSVKIWPKVSPVYHICFSFCSNTNMFRGLGCTSSFICYCSVSFSSCKWFDSLWNNYENALKSQKEVINAMQAGLG